MRVRVAPPPYLYIYVSPNCGRTEVEGVETVVAGEGAVEVGGGGGAGAPDGAGGGHGADADGSLSLGGNTAGADGGDFWVSLLCCLFFFFSM